jgi:hypothetical protein
MSAAALQKRESSSRKRFGGDRRPGRQAVFADLESRAGSWAAVEQLQSP